MGQGAASEIYPRPAASAAICNIDASVVTHADVPQCVPVHVFIVTLIVVCLCVAMLVPVVLTTLVIIFVDMVYNNTFAIEPHIVLSVYSKIILVFFFIIPGAAPLVIALGGLACLGMYEHLQKKNEQIPG